MQVETKLYYSQLKKWNHLIIAKLLLKTGLVLLSIILAKSRRISLDKDMVFIMEAQVFMTYTEPTRKLCMVVGSFLSGQVPIAFHDSTKLYVLLISWNLLFFFLFSWFMMQWVPLYNG